MNDNKSFKYKPYLSNKILTKNFNELKRIETEINNKLKDYDNFQGIDFCNVGAEGIQVRGHHKLIKGYTYGKQPTINYDFSNCKEVVEEFVDMWVKHDTEEKLKRELDFISYGEKYGWD